MGGQKEPQTVLAHMIFDKFTSLPLTCISVSRSASLAIYHHSFNKKNHKNTNGFLATLYEVGTHEYNSAIHKFPCSKMILQKEKENIKNNRI